MWKMRWYSKFSDFFPHTLMFHILKKCAGTPTFYTTDLGRLGLVLEPLIQDPGSTSILGGRGTWPQNLSLKFLLEPQILPPKM